MEQEKLFQLRSMLLEYFLDKASKPQDDNTLLNSMVGMFYLVNKDLAEQLKTTTAKNVTE